MKRFLALTISTILALPLFTGVFLYAQTTDQTTPETTTTTTETENTTETPEAKAISERIAKIKAELKTKIGSAEKARIQTKCVASQGKVKSLSGRIKGIETSRNEVHKNLINRLTGLSEKLKNKGIDTTTLDADITELQAKITTFNTDLSAYKQTVSDLAAMDCKTDPEGFKAALESARTSLDQVKQDGLAIRSYLSDTIKPLLKTIRAQVEDSKTEGSQ